MGSLEKKIRKRVDRFHLALNALEKQLEALRDQNNEAVTIPQTFDLSSVVSAEASKKEEARKKARNKRKTAGRKLAKARK